MASAKSFSLQVVQKYGSETVVYEASYVIEQTIMDYFYENLYIVSNSPVIIQKKGQDISSELQKAFDAAQEGYLDYVIQADVYYNLSDSNNPEEALLNERTGFCSVALQGHRLRKLQLFLISLLQCPTCR